MLGTFGEDMKIALTPETNLILKSMINKTVIGIQGNHFQSIAYACIYFKDSMISVVTNAMVLSEEQVICKVPA
jgi:hypothetical protein